MRIFLHNGITRVESADYKNNGDRMKVDLEILNNYGSIKNDGISYYVRKHNEKPNILTLDAGSYLKTQDVLDLFKKYKLKKKSTSDTLFFSNISSKIEETTRSLYKIKKQKFYLCFSDQTVSLLYDNSKDSLKILESFKHNFEKMKIGDGSKIQNIKFITMQPGGYFSSFAPMIKKPVLDVELNYGKEFLQSHNDLSQIMSAERKPGLILLHSDPGMGKSKYLEYLASINPSKNFYYLTEQLFSKIDSPNFMDYCLKNFVNAVLIIEDGETILAKRENLTTRSGLVSTLLNITDGILADSLNCKVICTFNTDITNIDDALLRKGRLIFSKKFNRLSVEEANKLYQHLNNNEDAPFVEETSLADVYAFNEKVDDILKNVTTAIGFNVSQN